MKIPRSANSPANPKPAIKIIITMFALLSTLDPEAAPSQDLEEEVRDENVLESVVAGSEDATEIINKFDLNTASPEDLLLVSGMSTDFADAIFDYRRRVKFIHSVDELSPLEGASQTAMKALRQRAFIREENNTYLKLESYMDISLQRIPLYREACGENGVLNFQRVSLVYRNFEFYGVSDKDPGEKNYFDFCSMSLAIKGLPYLSTIILGNYSISLGSGLLFSSASILSKGAGPVTSLFSRSMYSLRPYRSRQESRFLRGAAASVPVGKLELTGFASMKNFDARVDSAGGVTSIVYPGTNLPSVNTVPYSKLGEMILGGVLRYDSKWASFGISASHFGYDRSFAKRYPSNLTVYEGFFQAQSERAAITGEALLDKTISFSTCARIEFEGTQFAVGVRNLRASIAPGYSGPLAESYPSAMEQGTYFGAAIRILDHVRFGIYYDRFRIIPFSNDPEKNGEEISAESYIRLPRDFAPNAPAVSVYLRYKFKTKEDFYLALLDVPTAVTTISQSKQNFRIDVRSTLSRELSVRARIEKNFLASGEAGELFLSDYKWSTNNFSIGSRICFYKANSYECAFYVTEPDLPGVSEFTLFSGDGIRLMLLASVKVGGGFTAGVKAARDIYDTAKEFSLMGYDRALSGITAFSLGISYELR